LDVEADRVGGELERFEDDRWIRFGAVVGTLSGDLGDGLYALKSEDGRGNWVRFELGRRRATGTAFVHEASRGDTLRYGVDAARRPLMDGRRTRCDACTSAGRVRC
jgi:hypothetical protein